MNIICLVFTSINSEVFIKHESIKDNSKEGLSGVAPKRIIGENRNK